jgi:abelson tyrosine-protein kinase 1
LGTAGDVTHELLGLSVELLEFAPIPGLQAAAQTLLNIWDAAEQVDVSFYLCIYFCVRGIDDV